MRLMVLIFLLIFAAWGYWDIPHMLIALLAEQQLKRENPAIFTKALQDLKPLRKFLDENEDTIVEAAVMADYVKDTHFGFLESTHFFDLPYFYKTEKERKVNISFKMTSLSFVKKTIDIFKNKNVEKSMKPDFVRSISLRWLIHIVGDIHQPLHSGTLVSSKLFGGKIADGDWGGVKIPITIPNSPVKNLHALWDAAGLQYTSRFPLPLNPKDRKVLENLALDAKQRFPKEFLGERCGELNPEVWVNEGTKIVRNFAYQNVELTPQITGDYLYSAKKTTDRLIVLAGCRLASLLIHLYS